MTPMVLKSANENLKLTQLISRFLQFVERRSASPLKTDDKVVVVAMADEVECEKEMFVVVHWEKNEMAVPLSQLMPVSAVSEQTKESVEEIRYSTC